MNKLHILICTGGQLGEWAIPHIEKADLCIGADKGALFLVEAGVRPYLSIGDFDSVTAEQLELIKNNSQHVKDFDAIDKDYTDTELALHEAIALHPAKITIIGALGTRFDHSIANIQILTLADEHDIQAEIIDKHNKIRLISDSATISKDNYPYLSVLPFTQIVEGINLIGFKYPLENATIKKGQAIGISNIILGDEAKIEVRTGTLLVIQSTD